MVMRVAGLATGMEIDKMVDQLMAAERIPLRRLEQDRTILTWKQEAFRDINLALSELDQMMFDMKLSQTYQSKDVQSTQANAVTATGGSLTNNGNYHISVHQLATTAMNIGDHGVALDVAIEEEYIGEIKYYTYDEAGEQQAHTINIEQGDTVGDVLKKITNNNSPVLAFIDTSNGPDKARVVLETTRTGKYNINNDGKGAEIEFDAQSEAFFTDVLKLTSGKSDGEGPGEVGGQNAIFTYNHGLEIESKDNTYTINNLNLQFHNTTEGHAVLSVTNDVDYTFNKITEFVEKYNKIIEKLNNSQQEERYRDFPPLTKEQRDDMSEDEIKKWEEKAKSGILKGERVIENAQFQMRREWYDTVNTNGAFKTMSEIGLTTTVDYLDGGKIVIDEEKLKDSIRENPADVQALFTALGEDSLGIVHRLDKVVDQTMSRINDHAGRASTTTLDNFALGKRMKTLDQQIERFEERLVRIEERYWSQFTQMEKAVQRLIDQSSYLYSQFGEM